MVIAWDYTQKHLTNPKRAAGIFDADPPGIQSMKLTNDVLKGGVAKVFKLPTPRHVQHIKGRGIHLPITLETLYPKEVWEFSLARKHLKSRKVSKILQGANAENIIRGDATLADIIGDEGACYVLYEYDPEKKNAVAEYICSRADEKAREVLINFEKIIHDVVAYLFPDTQHPWL
jgi:hypothetical protein